MLTVYGIETCNNAKINSGTLLASCNSPYRLRYWNVIRPTLSPSKSSPAVATVLTVYGMRRSVRDSRGAKRRWGSHFSYLSEAKVKQRWLGNSPYCLRYWNIVISWGVLFINSVATAPTVYGMHRRVRDSRGAKRRWSPHISYLSEARVRQRW